MPVPFHCFYFLPSARFNCGQGDRIAERLFLAKVLLLVLI